jgi:hypothetical protein
LVRRLNMILTKQNLPPVPLFDVGIGLRPIWLLAGLIGLASGAIWAIPACLAGALHRQYVRRTSTRIRGELAVRVNMLLQRDRPAIDVPTPHGFRVACRNEKCGKMMDAGARFCPRCGMRALMRWRSDKPETRNPNDESNHKPE